MTDLGNVTASLVSIVLPAYNYDRYVAQAIDSVLAQTHPNFELIVIDDGSTDATPDIIAGYGDAIRAVRQENAGVNAAVRAGLDLARGTYLTTLGADDFWPEDRLERLAAALDDDPDLGLAWGDMAVVDKDGALELPSMRDAGILEVFHEGFLGHLLRRNFISGGSMMVRAALRDEFHPMPAYGGYEDWWVAWRIASVAPIRPVDGVVNYYRRHGENMNFHAGADRQLELVKVELPFRRWTLTTTDFMHVTPADLAVALHLHDALAQRLVALDRPCAQTMLAPDRAAARHAMHEASRALDVPDPRAAHGWLVRAAVHDPTDPSSRQLLAELTPLVTATPVAVA